MDFWGYHLMVDAGKLQCPVDRLNDVTYLKRFISDLLKAVDMKAWGEPVIMRLTEKDGEFPDNLSGYTCIQALHTSSCTLHICDKVGSLYFDLFSCRRFDNAVAVAVLQEYFQPDSVRVNYLTRQA